MCTLCLNLLFHRIIINEHVKLWLLHIVLHTIILNVIIITTKSIIKLAEVLPVLPALHLPLPVLLCNVLPLCTQEEHALEVLDEYMLPQDVFCNPNQCIRCNIIIDVWVICNVLPYGIIESIKIVPDIHHEIILMPLPIYLHYPHNT